MSEDILDSREIEEKIEELREQVEQADLDEIDSSEDTEELEMLLAFKADAVSEIGEDEWEWGITFISDNYFVDYTEELAKDLGYINGETEGWPFRHIDWDEAADDLKNDYSELKLGSEIYWGRE